MSTIEARREAETRIPIRLDPAIHGGGRQFGRTAASFVALGLLLYLALYAGSEWLVRRYAVRNRFHVVQTAPYQEYDYVVLGASHAAVFDYRDMNARLESLTGARIVNLANVGAGVTPNRLILDYFLDKRDTRAVVYVLDSFAFYSSEWNEDRLGDTQLYLRAPWDPAIVRLLLGQPGARKAGVGYLSGFPKINNADRFEPDLFPGEGSSFDRTYRPIAQLDRQRLAYLYPDSATRTPIADSRYLLEFEEMIRLIRAGGMEFLIVRPPIPQRIREMIPNEDEFDALIAELATRTGAELYDFSRVANDPQFFYDSDHLNQSGVLNFYENHLRHVLPRRRDVEALSSEGAEGWVGDRSEPGTGERGAA